MKSRELRYVLDEMERAEKALEVFDGFAKTKPPHAVSGNEEITIRAVAIAPFLREAIESEMPSLMMTAAAIARVRLQKMKDEFRKVAKESIEAK